MSLSQTKDVVAFSEVNVNKSASISKHAEEM